MKTQNWQKSLILSSDGSGYNLIFSCSRWRRYILLAMWLVLLAVTAALGRQQPLLLLPAIALLALFVYLAPWRLPPVMWLDVGAGSVRVMGEERTVRLSPRSRVAAGLLLLCLEDGRCWWVVAGMLDQRHFRALARAIQLRRSGA